MYNIHWQCGEEYFVGPNRVTWLTVFIDKIMITNQSFGHRRSRFDTTFKRSGVSVESKSISGVCCLYIWLKIFTIKIRWWTQVWAWEYFPDRQLVVWWHIPRQDRIQLSITSCHSSVFRDTYWGRINECVRCRLQLGILWCCIYWPTTKPKCCTYWVPHIGIELSIL